MELRIVKVNAEGECKELEDDKELQKGAASFY